PEDPSPGTASPFRPLPAGAGRGVHCDSAPAERIRVAKGVPGGHLSPPERGEVMAGRLKRHADPGSYTEGPAAPTSPRSGGERSAKRLRGEPGEGSLLRLRFPRAVGATSPRSYPCHAHLRDPLRDRVRVLCHLRVPEPQNNNPADLQIPPAF